MRITPENVHEAFAYHKPTSADVENHQNIAKAAENFARVILESCPGSAETTKAIRKVQSARMWANAAIALKDFD